MDDEETNLQETIENDMKNRDKGPVERKIRKEAKKQARQAAQKAKKKMRSTLFKRVGFSSFIGFFPLFIIVFMIVGIVSFITTMPGLVQEQILNKLLSFKGSLNYTLNGSDYYLTELARDEGKTSQKEILLYLDDMGIDPVGFGFAAFYTRSADSDGDGIDEVSYEPNVEIGEIKKVGGFFEAIDYNTEKAKERLREDLLLKYVISNERTYLVHDLDKIGNGNLPDGVEHLIEWLGKLNLQGMIETHIEGIDDSEISVDRENKQMVITSKNWEFLSVTNQEARYNLESWAGRYGMPLEFLLAIHLGTMTSDITDEMLSNDNLQTTMYVASEKGDYDVDYEIKYKGHDLEDITRGKSSPNYELIEWKGGMENYIVEKSDGTYGIDVADDELNSLRNAVSINSLYEWLRKLRTFDLRQDINADFITNTAYDAKEALLGDGMYRVMYRIQADFYDQANWKNTAWFGNIDSDDYHVEEYPNWKYTPNLPFDDSYSQDGGFYGGAEYNTRSYYDYENGRVYLFDMTDNTDDGTAISSVEVGTVDEPPVYFRDDPYYYTDGVTYNYTTGILHGINYYLDGHEDELRQEYVRYGITCILSQLDSYMHRWKQDKLSSEFEFTEYANGSYKSDAEDYDFPLIRNDLTSGDSFLYLMLTKEWWDWWENNPDPTTEQIHEELEYISGRVRDCFEVMDHREQHLQEIIDDMFEKTGIKEKLSVEDIDIIHDALENNSDDFEFVLPRITKVMKHWYKDVVFEDGSYSVYDPISELRFPLTLENENPDLEVNAVLTHKKGDGPYKQVSQPWVVKGDIVTVDGEVVKGSTAEDILKITDDNDSSYHIGDGYRTTKKLFTQGQYYTYDGSAETAKSIWYSKELEKLDGSSNKFAKAYVQNGRIILSWVYDGSSAPSDFGGAYNSGNSWNTSMQNIDDSRANEEICKPANAVKVADDGSWSVFLSMASINTKTDLPVNLYYIVANDDMGYVSAADNVDESRKSVERINALLEAMGVVTIRKPVSFDNTTVTGDVTTLTAFGLLEGMHTESAEYIYRDFKEFLIELGYYTKAEFDLIETNVLKWFIPEYKPAKYENRVSWNQAKDEDRLKYGAMLYPTEIDSDGKVINDGFEADLDVIAPGNCRVLEKTATHIKIEFDGISQPEIGALDKYTMIIEGIDVTNDPINVIPEGSVDPVQKTISEIVGKNYIVPAEEVIGKTGTSPIQVVLKNRIDGYVNDIEDYMSPEVESKGTLTAQKYQFTEDEIILLAYIINHECKPEAGAKWQRPETSKAYTSSDEMAMEYAKAVGYVLVNRALNNFGGYGTTIEQQSTAPNQYDGSFRIDYALAHKDEISAGSLEAARFCAKYACSAVVNPAGEEMTEDVIGESAWTFGHKIFWWLDVNENGKQDSYEGISDPPWPYDNYLTYSH